MRMQNGNEKEISENVVRWTNRLKSCLGHMACRCCWTFGVDGISRQMRVDA